MSELHKFLFEGLPVRGMLVRLTDGWQDILRRRANNLETGPYPAPVRHLLGEMTAAAVLMQANIKFEGALVTEGKEFPDGSMILGSPAKVVRQLTPEQIEGLRRSAQHYVENAHRFKVGLKKIA